MKKIWTILLAAAMVLGLCACQPKVENKKVTLKIVNEKGEEEVFESSVPSKTLEELLDSIASSGIISYEKTEGENGVQIASVNGVAGEEADHQYWAVYVNGELSENSIDKVELNEGDTYEVIYVPAVPENQGTLLGGWQTWDAYTEQLTDDEKAIFEKAMDGIVGVGYTPIRVLATQVVSGTNYAFLAQGVTVTAEPATDYYIITVYNDLNNESEIKAINKLDISAIETKDETGTLLGSWEVKDSGKPAMIQDADVQASFDQATQKLLGVIYNPLQVLASQVVNGTNYVALCVGKTVTENPTVNLYVVTWYADLQGNSEVTDAKMLNLEYYVSGE